MGHLRWENEGRWAFVDASPQPGQRLEFSGGYDLAPLLARIEHAVRKVSAQTHLAGLAGWNLRPARGPRDDPARAVPDHHGPLKNIGLDRDRHGRAAGRARASRPLRRGRVRLRQCDHLWRESAAGGGRYGGGRSRFSSSARDHPPEGGMAADDRAQPGHRGDPALALELKQESSARPASVRANEELDAICRWRLLP